MKTYTYKDLIESYKYFLLYKDSDPFFDYYVQRYKALSKSFGVDFDVEIKSDSKKDDLLRWFVDSVKATTKRINPFDGLMEAPAYIGKLYKEHTKDFIEAEGILHKAHFKFQCHLFELIYSNTESTVSSAELLKNGFDDSQNEPDITDFW